MGIADLFSPNVITDAFVGLLSTHDSIFFAGRAGLWLLGSIIG